jgi:hypothetical protein
MMGAESKDPEDLSAAMLVQGVFTKNYHWHLFSSMHNRNEHPRENSPTLHGAGRGVGILRLRANERGL